MHKQDVETLRDLLDVASHLLDLLNTCRSYAGAPLVPEDTRVTEARYLISRLEDHHLEGEKQA